MRAAFPRQLPSGFAWNRQRDRLLLSIQDDGQGFDVRQTKGLGLLGIQERVSAAGRNMLGALPARERNEVSVELPVTSGERGARGVL